MDVKPLSLNDMENVCEVILTLVSKFPELPFKASAKTIAWQSLGSDEGIGLFTLNGGMYLRQYVSGSYVGQMPFRIDYQVRPTTNKGRVEAQKILEKLGAWLEGCEASFEDKALTLQKIERTSPVIKSRAYSDGSEVYSCSMNIEYFYKN